MAAFAARLSAVHPSYMWHRWKMADTERTPAGDTWHRTEGYAPARIAMQEQGSEAAHGGKREAQRGFRSEMIILEPVAEDGSSPQLLEQRRKDPDGKYL